MRSMLALTITAVGLVTFAATATPVRAECMMLDRWPSFTHGAPSADRVLIGKVVEAYDTDSGDRAIRFRLRVDEVLRGEAPSFIDFDNVIKANAPFPICPGDSILRVQVGDVWAFAEGARLKGYPDEVLAVAIVNRDLSEVEQFLMPGIERHSRSAIRNLLDLPATDTRSPEAAPDAPSRLLVSLIAAVLAALLVLWRTSPPSRDIRRR